MKLNYVWLDLIIILFPGYAFAKWSEVGTIESGKYFWMESNRKTDFCYKRYIHSGYLTVVTLKHKEGKGDYDVRVFEDSGFGKKYHRLLQLAQNLSCSFYRFKNTQSIYIFM